MSEEVLVAAAFSWQSRFTLFLKQGSGTLLRSFWHKQSTWSHKDQLCVFVSSGRSFWEIWDLHQQGYIMQDWGLQRVKTLPVPWQSFLSIRVQDSWIHNSQEYGYWWVVRTIMCNWKWHFLFVFLSHYSQNRI